MTLLLAGSASAVLSQELGRGEIAESLMRPDGVVGVLPLPEIGAHRLEGDVKPVAAEGARKSASLDKMLRNAGQSIVEEEVRAPDQPAYCPFSCPWRSARRP